MTYTFILISLVFVIPYDSPKFHMLRGQRQLALKSIHRVYQTQGCHRTAQKIYNYIKKTSSDETSRTGLTEAFCSDERYVRASWISLMIIVFSELTGFQAIMLYSNIIFSGILGANGSSISPRQGTYIIAAVNFCASFLSIWTVRVAGRRTLLLGGHFLIALCHLLIGLFIIMGQGWGVIMMTCVFMFIYQNTCEPVGQIYVTETCSDIALGVSTQILWLVCLLESLTTESLMESSLRPEGVFILFGIFSMLAVGLEWFFVAETKGLSEREKKNIYIPGQLYGRKLFENEREPEIGSPVSSMFTIDNNTSSLRSMQSSFGLSNKINLSTPTQSLRSKTKTDGEDFGFT